MSGLRLATLAVAAAVAASSQWSSEFTTVMRSIPPGSQTTSGAWNLREAKKGMLQKLGATLCSWALCCLPKVQRREEELGRATFKRVESPSKACGPAHQQMSASGAHDIWRSHFEGFEDVRTEWACE